MFDSRKNNSGCNFGEEIVSYLYDEFTDIQKAEFENHLSNCLSCEKEVASFGIVRNSIQDWKEVEFNNLALPNIEIEYEQNKVPIQTVQSDEQRLSFGERINALLSPLFVKTATGFAAIAIMLGLGWFVFSSLQNEKQIADINKKESIEAKNDKDIEKSEIVKQEDKVKQSDTNTIKQKEIATQQPKAVNTTTNKNKINKPIITKASSKKRTVRKNNTVVADNRKPKSVKKDVKDKNVTTPKNLTPVIEKAPTLTDTYAIEDTAEDDIRLADIFDEVGSDD